MGTLQRVSSRRYGRSQSRHLTQKKPRACVARGLTDVCSVDVGRATTEVALVFAALATEHVRGFELTLADCAVRAKQESCLRRTDGATGVATRHREIAHGHLRGLHHTRDALTECHHAGIARNC